MAQGVEHHRIDLAAWTREYGAGLHRYFGKRARPGDVEDLVQEVFRRLESGSRIDRITDPQRYTFKVAHSVLVNYHRYRAARHFDAHDTLDDHEIADYLSPERIMIGRQEYQRAIAAVLALPPRARAAFQFHRFEDMTYEAIARRMGISHSSVKELVARALVSLTRTMRGDA